MKTKFNEKWLLDESPCSDGLVFARSCNFDFAKIYDTCERGDWLIWLLRRTKNLSKPQSVKIAITCAEHVISIYEKKYPNNKAPRNAINAAKKWLKEPSEENRKAAYAAADAAYAAAYAAADATDAAAYADAYAAADAAARLSERKWQANQIRKIVPNPFTN